MQDIGVHYVLIYSLFIHGGGITEIKEPNLGSGFAIVGAPQSLVHGVLMVWVQRHPKPMVLVHSSRFGCKSAPSMSGSLPL